MNLYGNKCEICNRKINEDEEIVVCPECGTPYHKSCYVNQGSCLHKDEHANGFEWKPAGKDKSDNSKICVRCGTENDANAERCTLCGYATFQTKRDGKTYSRNVNLNTDEPINGDLPPMFGYVGRNSQRFTSGVDLLGGVKSTEKIDGESVADIATAVGVNTIYYIPKFKKMSKEKSKFDINWAAIIFGPYWYFMRKCYLQAISSFVIMAACYFTATFEITKMYEIFGIQMSNWYTTQGTILLTEKLRDSANLQVALPFIMIYISAFILMIVNNLIWGCLGNHFYRKNIISLISATKEKVKEDNLSVQEKIELLSAKGGINLFFPLLAYFALQFVVMFV